LCPVDETKNTINYLVDGALKNLKKIIKLRRMLLSLDFDPIYGYY